MAAGLPVAALKQGHLRFPVILHKGGCAMIKVLLVEDDTIVAKIILYYLEEEKLYEVKWGQNRRRGARPRPRILRRHFDGRSSARRQRHRPVRKAAGIPRLPHFVPFLPGRQRHHRQRPAKRGRRFSGQALRQQGAFRPHPGQFAPLRRQPQELRKKGRTRACLPRLFARRQPPHSGAARRRGQAFPPPSSASFPF